MVSLSFAPIPKYAESIFALYLPGFSSSNWKILFLSSVTKTLQSSTAMNTGLLTEVDLETTMVCCSSPRIILPFTTNKLSLSGMFGLYSSTH